MLVGLRFFFAAVTFQPGYPLNVKGISNGVNFRVER